MGSYYIVETEYIGPNLDQDQYIDVDTIEIWTKPATVVGSSEPCTDGFCGSRNDWSIIAHGKFATLEAARAAIQERFAPVRNSDLLGNPFEAMDEDVVEIYKPGHFKPLTSEATGMWSYEFMEQEVTENTSDERIDELVNECRRELNNQGLAPHPSLKTMMEDYREELIESAQEDDD